MRLVVIVAIVGVILLALSRFARAAGVLYYVDSQGNLRSGGGTLVEAAGPPLVDAMNGRTAMTSPHTGTLADYCQKAFGTNAALIGQVPDKNAKYVQQGNNLLGDINCGAVGIASKAVSAVIVTPAKKVWNWVT